MTYKEQRGGSIATLIDYRKRYGNAAHRALMECLMPLPDECKPKPPTAEKQRTKFKYRVRDPEQTAKRARQAEHIRRSCGQPLSAGSCLQ